jgi:tetratricopeptide (TPR) repeat protein
MLLSAALIARDEEHRIEPCLQSIRGLVDEIVLVDTGSRDETLAIAQAYGARTLRYEWHDDFAAARNFGLDRCRGEWILYIDADERARPFSRTELEVTLERPRNAGLSVLLHARAGFSAYREMRLFRNDPRIRFEGLMHETIWPGIGRYLEEEGGTVGESNLTLDHVGYDGPQDHKHRRNLPLLKKALAANPEQVYCWYDLGRVYLGLGETNLALDAWQKAIDAARRKEHLRPADSLPFIELIQHKMVQGEPASELLDEAQALFPDDSLLRWLDAQRRIADGRLAEAIAILQSLADDYESGGLGTDFGYDPRQFTSHTYGAIGTCYYRLKRYGEARRYFARAEAQEPRNLEYKAKRQLCAHLETSSTAG